MRDETRIVDIKIDDKSIGQGCQWDGRIVFDKRISTKKQQVLLERLFARLKERDNSKPLLEFGPSTLAWDLADHNSAAIVVIKYRAEKHLRVLFYDVDFIQFGIWEPEDNVCDRYPECSFIFETVIRNVDSANNRSG